MHDVLTSDAFQCNIIIKIVLIGHVYTLAGYGDAGIPAVCACTVGEMNAMLTVVFSNEIVSGVGAGQPLPKVIVHH